MDSGGALPGTVWVHAGSPFGPDDPRRHRRWISYPRVLRGLHAARGRFLPLFCLSEPVRLLHAYAGPGRQLPPHVCWMGGRWIVLLPPHRFLVHAEIRCRCCKESIRRKSYRRFGFILAIMLIYWTFERIDFA